MKQPNHPKLNLPPEYSTREYSAWTTISADNGKRTVARVLWKENSSLMPHKVDAPPPVVFKFDEHEARSEEIPFDSVQAAVKYIETMCTLNAWGD